MYGPLFLRHPVLSYCFTIFILTIFSTVLLRFDSNFNS